MEILGSGHHSVVVAVDENSVDKFYDSQEEADREKQNLLFLHVAIKQGLDIKVKIPEFREGIENGAWDIAGKKYILRSRMERIAGIPMNKLHLELSDLLGANLGRIIAEQHVQLKPFMEKWIKIHGKTDRLAKHIVHYKAAKVILEENNDGKKRIVKQAAHYIETETKNSFLRGTLSHLDLNQSNILVWKGEIEGMVDWGSFGLTNQALSFYQLADSPLWDSIRKEYESLGGTIHEKLLYAAATIHFAWVPFRYRELGFPFNELRNELLFNKFSSLFQNQPHNSSASTRALKKC